MGVRGSDGWSAGQVRRLALMLATGASFTEIGEAIGKTRGAVASKIKRLEKAAKK